MSWHTQSHSRGSTSTAHPPSYHHSSSHSRSYHYRDNDNRHPRRQFSRDSSRYGERSRERRSSGGSSEDRVPRSSVYHNQSGSSRRYGDYHQSSSNNSFHNRYSQSHHYQRQQQQSQHSMHRVPRNMTLPPPQQHPFPVPPPQQPQFPVPPPPQQPQFPVPPPPQQPQFPVPPPSQQPPFAGSVEPPYSRHNMHNRSHTPNDPPLPSTPAPVKPPPPPPPEKLIYYNAKYYDEVAAAKAYKKTEQDTLDLVKGIVPVAPTKQPGEDNETVISNILDEIKGRGIFDKFRKDCIEAADSKPAFNNLSKRVLGTVNDFLLTAQWREGQNRVLREGMREKILYAPYFDAGIDQIVEQVLNPEVMKQFVPLIEDVVYQYLGVPKPSSLEDKPEVTSETVEADLIEHKPMAAPVEKVPSPAAVVRQGSDDESYSPCPSPPGESHYPLPSLSFEKGDANFEALSPVPASSSVNNDLGSKSEKPPSSTCMTPSEIEKMTIVNFLANQEMVSDDDFIDDDDEEEESPAFEKFGETSPPRVNPEELRKQFDIPLLLPKPPVTNTISSQSKRKSSLDEDDSKANTISSSSTKGRNDLIQSKDEATVGYFNCFSKKIIHEMETNAESNVECTEKQQDLILNGKVKDKSESTRNKHCKRKKEDCEKKKSKYERNGISDSKLSKSHHKKKSEGRKHHKKKKKHKHCRKSKENNIIQKDDEFNMDVPINDSSSDDQDHVLPHSNPTSAPFLYIEPIPSLGKKFEFYQPFINPLVMDDDVSVSSVDVDDLDHFEDTVRVNDVALTGHAMDWLQRKGARVIINGSSENNEPSSSYAHRRGSVLIDTERP